MRDGVHISREHEPAARQGEDGERASLRDCLRDGDQEEGLRAVAAAEAAAEAEEGLVLQLDMRISENVLAWDAYR